MEGRQFMVRIFTAVALALVLTGCAVSTKEAFYRNLPDEWTVQQRAVAWFRALELHYTLNNLVGRQIREDVVTVTDVYDVAHRLARNMESVTNPENAGWRQFLEWAEASEGAQLSARAFRSVESCLRAYLIQEEFARIFNAATLRRQNEPYDIKLLYVCDTLAELLSFEDPYLEWVRRENRLRVLQEAEISLNHLGDGYSFAIRVISYYIVDRDNPDKRDVAYVEVYRAGENAPFAKLLSLPGQSRLRYALVDLSIPGEFGYGVPDLFAAVAVTNPVDWAIVTVETIVQEAQPQEPPERAPITYHLHFANRQPIEIWEGDDTTVYSVPFLYDSMRFSLAVVFDTTYRPPREEADTRRVEWFEKRYRDASGRVVVVERFEPFEQFAIVRSAIGGDSIRITRPGEAVVEGEPEVFGRLTRVVFREGASNRARELWDSNGDGVWNRSRSVSWTW